MIDIIALIGQIIRLKFRDSWRYDAFCTTLVVFMIVVLAGIYL